MATLEQSCPDSIPSLRSTGLLGRLLGVGGRQVGLAVHLQLHGVLHLQIRRCIRVMLIVELKFSDQFQAILGTFLFFKKKLGVPQILFFVT